MGDKNFKAAAGTFALNKNRSIHNWYNYLEGYSSDLIENVIEEIGPENITAIYDPFCGTGTTCLVASTHQIKSFYSETNPFMRKVIESKTNSVKNLKDRGVYSKYLRKFLDVVKNHSVQLRMDTPEWDGFEKYFDDEVLFKLKDLKNLINEISDKDSKLITEVLLSSVVVRSSNMIRHGDLRFAKPTEKSNSDKDIITNFIEKLEQAIDDIDNTKDLPFAFTECLADDARDIDIVNKLDCVITSPPYLNGTNYIRNTKLELKLNDFITSEKELPAFHLKGIIAGINNVSRRKLDFEPLEIVSPYIKKLEPVAYDRRIPLMVSGYFNDMNKFVLRLAKAMKNNGFFVMDIGDSQFAGVHIPTHEILTQICENHGFRLYNEEILRKRRSRNGMILTQRLLKFRLQKKEKPAEIFYQEAKSFLDNLPYKEEPYSRRNWGHPWHSLCSYHGKLKPAIAHFLVKNFTNIGDVIIDPLGGVGTIPLEASLQGRIGIGNDLSELAFIVTKAKVEKPSYDESVYELNKLEEYLEANINSNKTNSLFTEFSEFGYNKKLKDYFHESTFREILCARNYFVPLINELSPPQAMVYSCLLHVLHGNRPYALSRNSHPLTPYAPTGEFVYKNVVKHISNKLELTYSQNSFDNYTLGKSIHGDFKNLLEQKIQADAVITSPPFAGSIRFYMQNWMRLWLCGWNKEDFDQADKKFLDQKQNNNFDVYELFFKVCYNILKSNGKIVLHLGKTKKIDMAEELSLRAKPYFSEIYRGSENVQDLEKHGIKDKGSTVEHQFLFLMKK